MGEFAWVTLATNDSYSLGALVLAHSLKQLGTKHSLVVLITPGVSTSMGEKLSEVFNLVEAVNLLDSQDAANLRLLKRPELGVTFTKLHCWRLTQFDKCVFLDADTLVLQNCDELFEREELSAAPDVGWPDCFNSGVFVYRPSLDTYEKLIQFALDKGSFDGGDQGLLNLYFSDWAHKDISKHLPFIYNMCSTASYSYLPAFKQFGTSAKIIHFIGATKPWLQYFDSESKKVHSPSGYQHLNSVLQLWWDIFCSLIHPNLSSNMAPSNSDVGHTSSSHHSYHRPHSQTPTSSPVPNVNIVWDPWEEYDRRQCGNVTSQEVVPPVWEKPIESHNTNASDDDESDHFLNPIHEYNPPFIQSNIISHVDTFKSPENEVIHDSESFSQENQNFEHIQVESEYTEDKHDEINRHFHQTPPIDSSQFQSTPELDPIYLPTENPVPQDTTNCENPGNFTTEPILHSPVDGDKTDTGLAGAFSKITLGVARTEEQSALEDHLRRQGWEVGNIDYLGRDSFDNIWTKICETLSSPPEEEAVQEPVAVLEPTATPTAETPATEANVEPISEVIQDTLKSTSPTESSTETYKSDITPTEQTVPAPKPALRPLTLIKEFPMPQVCPIIPSAPIFETCTLLESPVADVEALIELGDYVDFQQNIAEITDPIVTAQCTRIVAHSEVLPMEKLEAVPMETLSETSHTSSLDMPPLSGAKIGVKEATPVLQPPVIEGESDLPKSVPNVPQIPLTPAPTSQQSTLTDSVSSGPIEPPKSAPVSLTELDAPTKSASDVLPTPVSEIPKSSESSAKVQATIEQKSLTKEQPIAVEAVKAVGEIVPPKIPDSAVPSTTLPKETEKLLEASQLPEAPKLPEAAKLPAPPKLPETAKLPEHPKLPEAAKLPEPPKLPKPPKLPTLFKTPEYPKPPTPPQTPESPKASEAPKVISGLKASKDVKTTTKSEPVPVEPKPGAIKAPKSQEVAAPKTPDVTGATPPVTPGTASVQAQSKASSVDAPLPAIPQPNTAEGQTPTPPPRKTASNAAKKSSKPKK